MAKIEEIDEFNENNVEQFENVDEVIDASGLRHKLRHHPQHHDDLEIGEVFGAILYIIPFSFLYLLMDLLVSAQYNSWPSFTQEALQMAKAVPLISIIIFYCEKIGIHSVYTLTNTLCSQQTRKFTSNAVHIPTRIHRIRYLSHQTHQQLTKLPSHQKSAINRCVVIAVWVAYSDEKIIY
ncbi:hypothetical protein E3P99_00143 [Wallemia hederae]|uniref:Uncharacterized protein n=1 Tax=Wallemia hederae TaxID=1540922 RepID=A0A4V4LUZ7_9BASI|nr:hypothetical protein E3P99_00143 [Wallemia hederae]